MFVQLDLNNVEFQEAWFRLEKEQRIAMLEACVKISRLTWQELYNDWGLRWELIHSRSDKVYSIRITRKFRAIVRREGSILELLTFHPSHDSAY